MSTVLRARLWLVLVCFVLSLAVRAGAAPSPALPPPIPEPLRPWIDWAAPAGYRCAVAPDAKAVCAWPGRLELDVDDKGGTFRLEARLDEGESVALPGSEEVWPLDVKADGTAGVVLLAGGPRLAVGRGAHVITGRFAWTAIPSSLAIPAEIGLLRSLRVRGALIASPNRDKDGVSLVSAVTVDTADAGPAAPTGTADQVDIRVVRLLVSERPMRLGTWIRLEVSGKPRELLLGPVLPEGFVAIELYGKWPARIEPDGRIRIRVSAGQDDVVVGARATSTPTEIKRPAVSGAAGGTWTTGDEVWAFIDRDPFQSTSVEGPPRVPSSTLASFPVEGGIADGNCFAMKEGEVLRLVARPRMAAAGKDALKLHRVFDIAGDGSGISVADTIEGKFSEPTRLEFPPPFVPGEAGVGAQRQVLGSVDGRPAGFEVPASDQTVYANSWLSGVPWTLPVNAFGRTYQTRDVTFAVQAGWLPLYMSGHGNGLLDAIALGDLLLAGLVVALVFAAYGLRLALLAAVTLLLGLLFPRMPIAPFLVVAALGWIVTRAPDKRRPLVLLLHRAAVVIAALSLIEATHTSLLLAFEPESIKMNEIVEEELSKEQAEPSGGTGTKHKGAEGMMGDPSKAYAPPSNAPIAFDSDSSTQTSKAEMEKKAQEFDLRARSFDPNSLPQFGPGTPQKAWASFSMLVPPDQASVRAIWLPPTATAALFLLRVLASAALLIALFRFRSKGSPATAAPTVSAGSGSAAAAAALTALLAFSPVAHAQTPDHATLDDLKTRLASAPACRPNCTQIARVSLEARKKSLVLRMEVHAGEAVAFALPSGFDVADVVVDRRPADLVRIDGNLVTRIEPGIHEIAVSGTLLDDSTAISFGALKPHVVQSLLDGWTLDGVQADGTVEAVLTLQSLTPGAPAKATPTTAPDTGKGALAVMVSVRRDFDFDIEWKVRTTVVRLHGASKRSEDKVATLPVATAEVALLPGEAIVTNAATPLVPHDGKVTVTLEGAKPVTWTSSLAFRPELQLVAPAARDRFETWSYTSSSRWRVTHSGVRTLPDDPRVTFAPWPGESVTLTLVRPTGLPGATVRLESSQLNSTNGGTLVDLAVSAAQISALGWSLEIPDGYEIEPASMRSDWVLEGRTLRVKSNQVHLRMTRPRRPLDAIVARAPAMKVNAKGVAATTTVQTSDWILFASATKSSEGGRLSGTLVGLSLAIVFAFVARLLGQDLRRTAIAAAAGLMITTNRSLFALAAFAALLGLLEARRRWALRRGVVETITEKPTPVVPADAPAAEPAAPSKKLTDPGYTALQLVLGAFGIVAILSFIGVAVMQALYGHPTGARSAGVTLTWFLDRHDGVLPGAMLVTLPMFAYRLVMVAWLLAWAYLLRELLPWAWAAYSTGGALRPAAPLGPVSRSRE